MPKKADPEPEPEPETPPTAEHPHGPHDKENHDHKHDDHATKAELEEIRKHKHDPEKPVDEKPTPAVIDKPPAPVKGEKKERTGLRMLW